MKQRNAFAVAAHFRKCSKFGHKCSPRGGSKNYQREFMLDFYDNYDFVESKSPFWENIEAIEGHKLSTFFE